MSGRPISIADVVITPDLWARPPRSPDLKAENDAIRHLAVTMSNSPAEIFHACASAALALCRADSCGISLYERGPDGEEVFRWIALVGELKDHLNGTTPRRFSPCGLCVDSGEPLLMRRPELVYHYLDVGPPLHDVLLIPLTEKSSRLEATIWVVSHTVGHKFDAQDARVMQHVSVFTATGLEMARVAAEARAAAAEKEVLLAELDHRVKNILQMTSGILRLQLGGLTDPAARAAMDSARRRVLAMGQIHQIGSGRDGNSVSEAIGAVCKDLVEMSDPQCRVSVDAEPISLPTHKICLVALIVNELVTNALKHAKGDGPVTVVVSLRRTLGWATLSVIDDGSPLPTDLDHLRKGGLGLRLVRGLADQLGGALSIDPVAKRFEVVFPALMSGMEQTPPSALHH
jgi:two-component sensor histidine kinase